MRISKWSCGALVAAVLSLELFLRYGVGLGHPLLYVGDAAAGYIPAPNQDIYRFFVHIKINGFGMRSDDISRERAQGHRRILFVGDSVTFGTTYVDQHEIFTSIIKAWFDKNSIIPVDILNISAGGWAPANELGFLKSQGVFNSNVVVLVLNTNDLDQAFTNFEPSSQFPINNYQFALNELWVRYIRPRIFEEATLADPGSTSCATSQNEADVSNLLQTISDAKRIIESGGARFLIIFCPSANVDQKKYLNAIEELKKVPRTSDIKLIDMTNIFNSRSKLDVYFDGIHLKPLGHELVATAFLENIGNEF